MGATQLDIDLIDADGQTVFSDKLQLDSPKLSTTISIDSPQLWWPKREGTPYLYLTIKLLKRHQENQLSQRKSGSEKCLVDNDFTIPLPKISPKQGTYPQPRLK